MSPLLVALSLLALWQPAGAVPQIMKSLHNQNLGSCIAKDHQSQVGASIAYQAKTGDGKTQLPALMSNTMMLADYVANEAMEKSTVLHQSHGRTCELDDPKSNEVLSDNVDAYSVANKTDLLSDAIDTDMFNCALLLSHILSAVCTHFLSRLLVHRKYRIRTVARVRNRSHRMLQKKLKGYDCIDRLGFHLKVLLSSSLTNVRSRRFLASRLKQGVLNSSFQQFKNRKKSRSVHRNTSKALFSIISDYFQLVKQERDSQVLIKLLELERTLYGDLTYRILENRAYNDYLIILAIIEENESIKVRFTALELINGYFIDDQNVIDQVANRSVEVFLKLVTGFRANNGRLLGDAPFEFPRDCWEMGRREEAEVMHIFDMLRFFIRSLDAEHLTKMCTCEHLMHVIFDGLANEAEMNVRMEGYMIPSWPAITLANLLRYGNAADRELLRGKYIEELPTALMKFDFKELTKILHHDDNTAYIVENPVVFNHVIFSIRHADMTYEMGQRYRLSVGLLGYGLRTDPLELQRMLGLDLLRPAARYLAHNDWFSDREEASVLSDILLARPEWNEPFRIATVPGNPSSHTALLGLTIIPRRSNPGIYVIIDEDCEDF